MTFPPYWDNLTLRRNIFVVGYPRSGNTYLCQLLADVLDAPICGYRKGVPIGASGFERQGKYVIRQLHLRPLSGDCKGYLPDNYHVCERGVQAMDRFIVAIRDPWDTALSVNHYWQVDNVEKTLEVMKKGKHPLHNIGPWANFYYEWDKTGIPHAVVRYEKNISDPHTELVKLLAFIGELANFSSSEIGIDKIAESIHRNSFENRRKINAIFGDRLQYGKTVQDRHMWRGKVGTWRELFGEPPNYPEWEEILRRYGYAAGKTNPVPEML